VRSQYENGFLVTQTIPVPVEASGLVATGIRYSICTLVTNKDQYDGMLSSFADHGFNESDCEFIQIDNSNTNQYDAYQGLNLFLTVARGEYIIICHQDILLIDDRVKLDAVLEDLDRRDPAWALCGNAGGQSMGKLAIRITDPHGADQRSGTLPVRVRSLDENFLLVRRCANLPVSSDLSGFHLYGADICILAEIIGRSAYVVDFHLAHISPGKRDRSLAVSRRNLARKYSRAFSGRWVRTTCELIYLSSDPWLSRLLSSSISQRLILRASAVWRRMAHGGPD
jgi:hypothetical protein